MLVCRFRADCLPQRTPSGDRGRGESHVPYVEAEGRTIYTDSFGDPEDPALLLVNGLTSQLISWNEMFCQAFVDRGFFVIRYDNRDVGLSTFFIDGPDYTLSDMADDGIEVLNHYGVDKAHIFGISMGGMIVQVMAIDHPERVLSMTSYASHTGHRDYGRSTDEALVALLEPEATTREDAIAAGIRGKKIWGTDNTWTEEEFGAFCGACWDRSEPRGGGARQYAAILKSGNRDDALATLDVPTLVIHGDADTLITPSGGEHTADVIPGAQYVVIDGMGHDIPMPDWPQIVQLVTMHAANAATSATEEMTEEK